MKLMISTIGSGSKGNCSLISSSNNKILIDCGLTVKRIVDGLTELNSNLKEIDGILITHEHTDHIKSLQELASNYEIPIYAHYNTWRELNKKFSVKNRESFDLKDGSFSIGDIEILPFRVSHDTVQPVGYRLESNGVTISYATDLGYISAEVKSHCEGADVVLLESNHDLDMLLRGHYPPYLKNRIVSNRGHLSNLSCATAIQELSRMGTKHFVLGHISEDNNLPELAFFETASKLKEIGLEVNKDYHLTVASQLECSGFIGV